VGASPAQAVAIRRLRIGVFEQTVSTFTTSSLATRFAVRYLLLICSLLCLRVLTSLEAIRNG
jgi:hypothetical protein